MSENNIESRDIDFSEIGSAILRRKKILYFTSSVALITSIAFTTYERIVKPIYSGNFVFLVNNPLENSSKEGSLGGAKKAGFFNSFLTTNTQQDIPTLIELLKSPSFLKPFANNNNLNAVRLSKKLLLKSKYDGRTQSQKGSINVEYQSNDPDKVLKILSNLRDFYLDVALLERRKQLTDGIKFLSTQKPVLEEKSLNYQNQLTDFRIKNKIGDPNSESDRLKQRLEKLDVNILNSENRGYRLKEIKKEIKLGKLSVSGFSEIIDSGIRREGMLSQGGISVKYPDDGFLQKTLELENELAQAKTSFLPTSTRVLNLEKKLELLKPEIKKQQLDSLDLSISLNKSKLESLKAEKEVLTEEFLRLANLIEPYNYIIESLKYARLAQLDLETTRDKFNLERSQKRNSWRVLQDPIVKSKPIKPSYFKNLLLALVGGTFIGIILALIRDSKDNVFHSLKEIEETNLTMLGKIPYTEIFDDFKSKGNESEWFTSLNDKFAKDKQDNEKNYQKFFYQESFRNLFTSIKFMGSETPLKTIALTSAEASEGKSLISIMLSKTLSEIDQKILLIDCDMRRPQLHKRLNLNNINGLTNILTEKDGTKNWEKFVQDLPHHKSWKVITCGTIPPDPTRILSSNKMKEFVNILSKEDKFDLIIFDTPPAVTLSDASLVGSNCDGLIVVASIEKVNKELFYEAINKLNKLGSKVLGLVSNECSKPKKTDQRLRYQYQYVYSAYGKGSLDDINSENKNVGLGENTIISHIRKYYLRLIEWLED